MSEIGLWIVTALYLWASGELFWAGKAAMSLVFAAYAVANVGLIFAARGGN